MNPLEHYDDVEVKNLFRFERANLASATDGEGVVLHGQIAGPLLPRSAEADMAARARPTAEPQATMPQQHAATVFDMATFDDRMNDGTGTFEDLRDLMQDEEPQIVFPDQSHYDLDQAL